MWQRIYGWAPRWLHPALHSLQIIWNRAFRIDPDAILTHSPREIEQERRTALLQLMLGGTTLALILQFLFQVFFLPQTPLTPRVALAIAIALGVICIRQSVGRFAEIAYLSFLFLSLSWVVVYTHFDPSGLSVRTVLIHSIVAVQMLAAGLLVPRRFLWLVNFGFSGIALINVLTIPLHTSISSEIRYPYVTSFIGLGTLYLFTAMLAWGWGRSMGAGMNTLEQAYNQRQAINEEKDAFLHIASHELKAPLTPIVLTSRRIEQRARQLVGQEELQRLASSLVSQSKHMSEMVDLLLDLTRIDQGRFIVDRQPNDLARIIREATAAQQSIWHRDVTLIGVSDPIMAPIDDRRLWQVMTNLVANAMKYTPSESPIEVTIHIEGSHVSVHVRDQGPGIPVESVSHVFERFYQAHHHKMHAGDGLGLGLYICQAIIEAHQGRIWVESAANQGATFIFEIPLAEGKPSPLTAPSGKSKRA